MISEIELATVRAFTRAAKTILFADVVGSVRLIEADEEGALRQWFEFLRRVEQDVLTSHNGRLVKQLGDGMMLEFDSAIDAVNAAVELQLISNQLNTGLAVDARMNLRIGLHGGEVISGFDNDLYGKDVNIAARVMSLAGAGEIAATVDVRDYSVGKVDVEFYDMGDCHVRSLPDPVRVFRIVPPGLHTPILPVLRAEDLLPTIAVIPPSTRQTEDEFGAFGEVVAEEIIVALSQSAALNVTSRLSTSAFADGSAPLSRIGEALHADFVLSGTYRGTAQRIILDLELAEVRSNRVIWASRFEDSFETLLQEQAAIDEISAAITGAIVELEVRRVRSQPLPTLENYALLMAATALMHRPSQRDFEFSEHLLSMLIKRTSDLPITSAALARWHVLRVQQGWTDDPMREAQTALRLTESALDLDPTNVMALVSEGFVLTNLLHRLDDALDRYNSALDQSPSDALGRLLRGTLYAFRGDGASAVRDTERALHLAPRDPHRYFFESLAASACIADGDNKRAFDLASQSLRSNRGHTSTLRVKAVAEFRLGREDDARESVRLLMRQQPNLTVSGWLKSAASAEFDVGKEFARTLREAGVPP